MSDLLLAGAGRLPEGAVGCGLSANTRHGSLIP